MGATAVYYVPESASSSSASNFKSLANHFALQSWVEHIGRWSFEYRYLRETPELGSGGGTGAAQPRDGYLQLLTVSHHPQRVYVAGGKLPPGQDKSAPLDPPSLSVVKGSSSDDLFALLKSRFASLWTPRRALAMINGLVFRASDFVVRFGEVRQGQGSVIAPRGLIMEIEWVALDDFVSETEVDASKKHVDEKEVKLSPQERAAYAEVLRNFCATLPIAGFSDTKQPSSIFKEKDSFSSSHTARQYLDALHLR